MIEPKRIVVEGKLLDELWGAYLDSLDLEGKEDLTEWRSGELFVLRRVFGKICRK
ncbi:hypothetical protein KAT36_02265 [Candidatus Pacearchaeota archaeon]|nr:hypothetical protein [Candidatus Pacearchaeota archaeon]